MSRRQRTPAFTPKLANEKYSYEVSLEHQLIKLWMLNNVSESYQALVLRYIDLLPNEQMQKELQKQIKKTYERQTYDFKIRAFYRQREQSLEILHKKLTLIQMQGTISHKQLDLSEICDMLDHMRKIQMIITEQIINMFKYFRYQPERDEPTIGKHYWKMFKKFGQDIIFLQQSVLIDYVPFSEEYDPLLLEPVRTIKKLYDARAVYYNKNIEELFTVNVSYLYRMMRAHQVMVKYANLYYSIQEMSPLEVSRKRDALTTDRQYVVNEGNTLRLEESDYIPYKNKSMNIQNGSNNKESERQKESISLQKTQERPRHFTISHHQIDVNYGPKKQSKHQQTAPVRIKKDKRSLYHCQPVVVFTYAKTPQKRSTTPPSQNLSNENYMLPKLLNTQIPKKKYHRPEIVESQSEDTPPYIEERSITEPMGLEQKLVNSRKMTYKGKVDRGYRSNTSRTSPQKNSSRINHSNMKNQKNFKRIELPHLSRVSDNSRSRCKETADCACRQKYKNRKKQKQFRGNSLEQYEQKRKEIVKNIKLRHKQQAQKQINYELSRIGDRTYHQIKYKAYRNKKQSRVHMHREQEE